MGRGLRSLPPVLIPLAVLAAACVVAMALPFRMIEPDDDDYFYGMHAFARGEVVMTEAEARELHAIPLPDPTKARPQMVMGIRTPKGFIRERSPGHYALLAGFHKVGLDRYANAILAFGIVAFFYGFVRRHVEESSEVAVLASLLLIVNPTFLTMLYRVYMSDFDYFAWATLSLGLYFMARRTRRLWLCALAGLSLSLSVFFRNTNAIAFLVVVAYEAVAFVRRRREPFGWSRAGVLVGAIAVGLIPLIWYSHVTTGQLFGSGYQYRMDRESSAYFALWDARAVFSLRHLFLGDAHGFMSQGYTLSVGVARLLLGFPLVVLVPAALAAMGRRRLRPALFLALWVGLFWGIYLCYRTIRGDSFQFMCRKLSPGLAPLAAAAGAALGQMPRKARYATLAMVGVLSLGVTSEFFLQFLGPSRMPPGPPRMDRPGEFRPPAKGPGPDDLLPPPKGPGAGERFVPNEVVRRLHGLMREAERRGIDVSKARELDEASKDAAQRGDWQENRRLLQEAVRLLQRALDGREGASPDGPQPEPRRPEPKRGGRL